MCTRPATRSSAARRGKTDAQKKFVEEVLSYRVAMYKSMDDDFNTAGAIAALHDLAGIINRYIDTQRLEIEARQADKRSSWPPRAARW